MQEAKKTRHVWQYAYIIGTLLIFIVLGIVNPELAPLFHGELPVNAFWLSLCGAAIIGYWLIQSCVYAYIGRMVGARISFWRNIRVMMFGEYYSALTPFASGGQPMQLGYYKRYGVSMPKASSILAVRYIGYVSSICICFTVAYLLEGQRVYAEHPVVFWLTLLGFAVNLFSLVMVALLLLKPAMASAVGSWIICLITKIKPLERKRERWLAAYQHGINEYALAAQCVRKSPLQCVVVMLMSLASVASQFSITYFVYRAVGLTQAGYWQLISMQIYLYLAVSFAPTPGATGATEGGFYLFFNMLFPQSMLYSAMLLWRLFTYYSNLLFGAVLVVNDELHAIRTRKQDATIHIELEKQQM